jgi:hypothetical protein
MRVVDASPRFRLVAVLRLQRRGVLSAAAVAGALLAVALVGVFADSGVAALPTCFGQAATIVGTTGADTLNGTSRNDVIVGLGGDDTIIGGDGNDLICAGSGDDGVNAGAGDDRIMGEEGYDLVVAGSGADYVDAGPDNDGLYGGAGTDELHGGLGSDYVRGGGDADTLLGEDDDDALYGDAGADTATGAAGSDLCVATTTADCESLTESGPCPPAFAAEIGVRDPSRLAISDPCYAVTGTVTSPVVIEADGDRTFTLTADGSGEVLHVEFVARDQGHFVLPTFNSRMSLVGARATDEHAKLEVHAVFQETYQGTTYSSGPQYGGNPKKSWDTPCWSETGANCTWDKTPPTAPTGVTATATSATRVNLRWAPASDDVAVTRYAVLRNGTQIARPSATSYADNGVQAGVTYKYTVRAQDSAGNTSPDSTPVSVTTPTASAATRTLTFQPSDDATIVRGSGSTNFGTATSLTANASPRRDFLLKFGVTGIGTGTVLNAQLRMYGADPSNNGGNFHRVGDVSWAESSVTWNTAPAGDAAVLGAIASIGANNAYDLDVTPLVTGDGTYGVRADTASTDMAGFSSKEGAHPAQLIVTVSDQSDTTSPTAPTALTASVSSPTRVDLAWAPASDDTGVTGYEVYRGPAGGALTPLASIGAATSYSDTTASPGVAYDYQVKAVDPAGNRSDGSNTATVTTPTPPPTTTLTFAPDADATVQEARPSSNFGTLTTLKADGDTGAQIAAYLRFTVTGVSAGQTVQNATLRLFVPSDGTADGPPVYPADNDWTETAITWSTRSAAGTTAADDLKAIPAGTWAQYQVTPLVTGNGTYTFVLGPSTSIDGVVFNSREGTSNKPELVLTVTG